jgi:hypothetical protein
VIPGEVFGHLKVLELLPGAEVDRPSQGTQVRVACVCGKRRTYPARRVMHGHLTSCGCMNPVSRRTVAYWPTEKGWAAP